MKIKIDEFRTDAAEAVDAPLDFVTLCSALAASQASTPTARIARDSEVVVDHSGQAHPAVAALRAVPGDDVGVASTHGSFHLAAAARFGDGLDQK